MAEDSPSAEAQRRGHEFADVNARALAWSALAVVLTMIVCAYIAYALIGALAPDPQDLRAFGQRPAQIPAASSAPSRGLPSTPIEGSGALARKQEALLHGYGWVDEEAGIVHIPIERAMKLIATGGLPDFREGSPVGRRP
jgi:hypothetical protein